MTYQLWLTADADVRWLAPPGSLTPAGIPDVAHRQRPARARRARPGRTLHRRLPEHRGEHQALHLVLGHPVRRVELRRIDGHPVVRADLSGYTDGTPPGQVTYDVLDAAQELVGEQP